MEPPQKKLPASFYQTPNGNEPVRAWLKGLERDDCRAVGTDIATVEYAWPMGKPLCDSLGGGLWEVRSNISDGRFARVIFCIQEGRMFICTGLSRRPGRPPRRTVTWP
jgi:hypothetical protein